MLLHKPHAVTVFEADEDFDPSGALAGTGYEGGTARSVQITPMKAGVALERFGLDAQKPHTLLDDLGSEGLYLTGNLVVYGSRMFKVAMPAMVWDAEPQTSCVEVVLEETTVGNS